MMKELKMSVCDVHKPVWRGYVCGGHMGVMCVCVRAHVTGGCERVCDV